LAVEAFEVLKLLGILFLQHRLLGLHHYSVVLLEVTDRNVRDDGDFLENLAFRFGELEIEQGWLVLLLLGVMVFRSLLLAEVDMLVIKFVLDDGVEVLLGVELDIDHQRGVLGAAVHNCAFGLELGTLGHLEGAVAELVMIQPLLAVEFDFFGEIQLVIHCFVCEGRRPPRRLAFFHVHPLFELPLRALQVLEILL